MSGLGQLEQRVATRIRSGREARLRRLPRLRVISAVDRASNPTVYYICPDLDVPAGGIRTIYRHVDALNSVGIRAAVVHKRSGFTCSWFEHQTVVIDARAVTLTSADVLVVPEFCRPSLSELPAGPRLVIFNQGAYHTFDGDWSPVDDMPYSNIDRIEGVLVVSHDNADYVQYAFPELRVKRIRNVVDSRLFYPAASLPGRRIAIMPRRRHKDCTQVLRLLAARGCLDNWDIVRIEGRSESGTASILRSCAFFLSFSEQEGFGMPPAEAMACGSYVIGFTGLGGREFFDPDTCTPIEEGDVLAFAKAVERSLIDFDEDGTAVRKRALAASAKILAEYSLDGQRADLQAFFGSIRSLQNYGQGGTGPGRHADPVPGHCVPE